MVQYVTQWRLSGPWDVVWTYILPVLNCCLYASQLIACKILWSLRARASLQSAKTAKKHMKKHVTREFSQEETKSSDSPAPSSDLHLTQILYGQLLSSGSTTDSPRADAAAANAEPTVAQTLASVSNLQIPQPQSQPQQQQQQQSPASGNRLTPVSGLRRVSTHQERRPSQFQAPLRRAATSHKFHLADVVGVLSTPFNPKIKEQMF